MASVVPLTGHLAADPGVSCDATQTLWSPAREEGLLVIPRCGGDQERASPSCCNAGSCVGFLCWELQRSQRASQTGRGQWRAAPAPPAMLAVSESPVELWLQEACPGRLAWFSTPEGLGSHLWFFPLCVWMMVLSCDGSEFLLHLRGAKSSLNPCNESVFITEVVTL